MTRTGIIFWARALAGAIAVVSCDGKPAPAADAGPSPRAIARLDPTPPSASPGVATPPRPPAPRAPCRAVTVEGDVRAVAGESDAGTPLRLAAEGEVPEDTWIALARGARFVAKDPRTTRETLFYGPGRARACAGRREESWIAGGAFESERGAGETPGAEEWVVTRQGVVRFAAAKLRVSVGPHETTASVANGVALLWTAADAHAVIASDAGAPKDAANPWQRMSDGTARIAAIAPNSPLDAAKFAVEQCAAVARRSEELTRALLAPHDEAADHAATAASDGKAITDEVSTREVARAACAVAALRVSALPSSAPHADLDARLRDAEQAWIGLPIAAAATPR